jgi:hypothetical protein
MYHPSIPVHSNSRIQHQPKVRKTHRRDFQLQNAFEPLQIVFASYPATNCTAPVHRLMKIIFPLPTDLIRYKLTAMQHGRLRYKVKGARLVDSWLCIGPVVDSGYPQRPGPSMHLISTIGSPNWGSAKAGHRRTTLD